MYFDIYFFVYRFVGFMMTGFSVFVRDGILGNGIEYILSICEIGNILLWVL